jgi:hypothetical protein
MSTLADCDMALQASVKLRRLHYDTKVEKFEHPVP